MKTQLDHLKSLHFIGIGGSGMAPLAAVLAMRGYNVSGSDLKASDGTKKLEHLCRIFTHHDESHIEKVDAIVISSAIKEDNIELIAAKKKHLPIFHRSDVLAYLIERSKTAIAVCGTHGKTTTTGLLGFGLEKIGKSPLILLGGIYEEKSENLVKNPISELLVAEADESDGSFLKYRPDIIVLTNIEEDHLDHFGDLANIEKTFSTACENISKNGYLIYCYDDPLCRQIANKINCQKISFGLASKADVSCYHISYENTFTFAQIKYKNQVFSFKLPFFGKHNILNLMASLAAMSLFDPFVFNQNDLFISFKGIKKRQSFLFEDENKIIIDDYAHNPKKIASLLSSIKDRWKDKQIVAVFEPHRYSRVNLLMDLFVQAFDCADLILSLPVFSAGEMMPKKDPLEELYLKLEQKLSKKIFRIKDARQAYDIIESASLKKPFVVVFMGAGLSSQRALDLVEIYENQPKEKLT